MRSGITLIALVITIVILIILATVAINAIFGDNGLITSAEKGKLEQEKAEARERLSLVLADAYTEKITNKEEYDQNQFLNDFIVAREPEAYIEGPESNEISLNGHTFELNREVPELGDYLGEAGNLPARISKIEYTVDEKGKTISVTVSAVRLENVLNPQYKYYIKEEGKEYIEKATQAGNTYEFSDLEEKNYIIKVELIGDVNENYPEGLTTYEETGVISLSPPYYPAEVPKISDGMTPVKWNGTNWVKTTENDTEWYNYAKKEWANVVLGDATFTASGSQEILDESKAYSMLVWIPRYAYQITSQYHQNGTGAGNINIVFIDTNNQNKSKTQTYNENYPSYTTGSGMSDYVVHPAFNYGGTKLAGFWVGKYETSHSGSTTIESTGSSNTNVTTLTATIRPNVTSWRNITISNIYTVCTELNKTGNPYGLNTSDTAVDPHLMKNSEWGAVAYLSQNTTYGKGTEVTINDNSSYITAAGNYKTNTNQSTTGNVTGIYDISGGAYEYVAAYVNNGSSILTTYGKNVYEAEARYKDVYKATSTSGSDSQSGNYNLLTPTEKYGDAVYETSSSYSDSTSWYADHSDFPGSLSPFFERGGGHLSDWAAGLFYFYYNRGNDNSGYSFRVVLPVM